MHLPTGVRLTAAAALSAATLGLGLLTPATAFDAARTSVAPSASADCFTPGARLGTTSRGGQVRDHREVPLAEQRRIEAQTRQLLQGRRASQGAVVPVYVHVMAAKNGAGNPSRDRILRQVKVLNTTFSGSGFSFTLQAVDRFRNDAWHQDRKSVAYRTATRQGGADALNIWLVDFEYLGIATFPWDYAEKGAIDGIRVNVGSLPGGPIANYNQGKTATHEAGHWFGLYHTFQGGCTTTNDRVSDTPAQSSATSGCPAGRDSCSLPGLDPIHNYMDYSYDPCYTNFSDGQKTRMLEQFAAYRG